VLLQAPERHLTGQAWVIVVCWRDGGVYSSVVDGSSSGVFSSFQEKRSRSLLNGPSTDVQQLWRWLGIGMVERRSWETQIVVLHVYRVYGQSYEPTPMWAGATGPTTELNGIIEGHSSLAKDPNRPVSEVSPRQLSHPRPQQPTQGPGLDIGKSSLRP
jgi:hypothetical protein